LALNRANSGLISQELCEGALKFVSFSALKIITELGGKATRA